MSKLCIKTVIHFISTGGPLCGTDRDAVGSILRISPDSSEELGTDPQLHTNVPTDHTQQCGCQRSRYSKQTRTIFCFGGGGGGVDPS